MGSDRKLVPAAVVFLLAVGCSSPGPRAGREAVGHSISAIDAICGEAPSATLDGFPAYAWCGDFDVWTDNGIDTESASGGAGWVQTEGGYGYQCVEWAVRYFYFKWSVTPGWFVGYAKDMCGTHPADVSVTTSPVHGDLAVFTPGCAGADPTAGHVAAIDTVGSSTIGVVQENPAGAMTWPTSCVACYLHAATNGGKPDPCSSAPYDGYYCGQSTQWGGAAPDVLYDCQGGVTTSTRTCQYGCQTEPLGTNDQCAPAPPDAGMSSDSGPRDGGAGDTGAAREGGHSGHDGGRFEPPPVRKPSHDQPSADESGGGCAVAAPRSSSSPSVGFGLLALVMLRRRPRTRTGPTAAHR